MISNILRAAGYAVMGFIALPIVVGFGSLILMHMFDSRCGTPGDSGGCEMGAAMLAFYSAPMGALIGIGGAIWGAVRRQ